MATIPPITKISSQIIRVLGCNPGPMTLQGTNTYIIGSGRRRILLDTGDSNVPEYIEHLKKVVMDERITINNIIVSHWHHDHVGGVDDVIEALGIQGKCTVWKYHRTDATEPQLRNATFCMLKNGQRMSMDGATIEIVHTPGHTTDHIVLLLNEDRSLFSCDCILGEGTTVFEDLYQYMKSLQVILDIQPTVIYPGHGNVIHDPIKRITNYINHRNQREIQIMAFLEKHLDESFTAIDLVKQIYKDTPEHLWPAACQNVGHHLQKLKKEKKIIQKNDRWKLVPSSTL